MFIRLNEKQLKTIQLIIESEIRDEQERITTALNEYSNDLNNNILSALKDRKILLSNLLDALSTTYTIKELAEHYNKEEKSV